LALICTPYYKLQFYDCSTKIIFKQVLLSILSKELNKKGAIVAQNAALPLEVFLDALRRFAATINH
jgi:hypothetical protein